MKEKAADRDDYPPILFFYQGTPDEGAAFFRRLWPEARAVSDKDKMYYDAFGIKRGGYKEIFGPGVWACGARATAKGHTVGKPGDDPWMMPGLFLVDADGRIRRQHDFAHVGDHPDWDRFPHTAAPSPPS